MGAKTEELGGLETARSRIVEDEPGRVLHLALPAQPAALWRRFGRSLRYLFYPVFRLLLRRRARDQELAAGHVRSIRLDREGRTLILGLAPSRIAPPLEWTLDLTGVQVARVQTRRDKHGLALHFALRDSERSLVSFDVRVVDLEQRSEALDLAFRLARVAGLRGYRVRRREDPDALDVELVREAAGRSSGPFRTGETGGAALPVPEHDQPADYEAGPVPAFIEPDDDVPSIDPESIDAVTRWDPGKSVVLYRPGDRMHLFGVLDALTGGILMGGYCSWWIGIGLGVVTAVCAFVLDMVGFDLTQFQISADQAFLTAGIVYVIATVIIALPFAHEAGARWWHTPPQEVTFDWEKRIVTVSLAAEGSARQWGMGDIQGVRAWPRPKANTLKVELLLPGEDIELLRMPPESARAMAISLARVLDVPWRGGDASPVLDS